MSRFETVQFTEKYRDRCEDRATVIHDGDRAIIVVADGAGGAGSGDSAAETVIREVGTDIGDLSAADQWDAKLKQIDFRVVDGESTAVVVDLRPEGICGSSVGDSQAWIVEDGRITDLTRGQRRKPLLGSGEAQPVGFSHPPLTGILIVATDGFCNYVKRSDIAPMLSRTDFFAIPRTCVEMVRLPSGELWDDIAIVACRLRLQHRTRRRYVL